MSVAPRSAPGFCWVSGSMSRTAWELAPDSKKTSRMSISLRNSLWPQEQVVPAGGISSGGEHLFGRVDVPGVGELAHEKGDDGFVDGGVAERLAALAAEEDGDGDTPYLLAGDAPVGGGGHPVGGWVLGPPRGP